MLQRIKPLDEQIAKERTDGRQHQLKRTHRNRPDAAEKPLVAKVDQVAKADDDKT